MENSKGCLTEELREDIKRSNVESCFYEKDTDICFYVRLGNFRIFPGQVSSG